tara:strand:- start:1268 stop:1552 length:285 start_codon:yes stop_codon:yes gene_type:complete
MACKQCELEKRKVKRLAHQVNVQAEEIRLLKAHVAQLQEKIAPQNNTRLKWLEHQIPEIIRQATFLERYKADASWDLHAKNIVEKAAEFLKHFS